MRRVLSLDIVLCSTSMALRGIKVVEFMGLLPGPLCGRFLADFGASVTVIQKTSSEPFDVLSSGKRLLSVNLKSKEGVEIVKKLCTSSDVVLDTFRPGILEKMGLGPQTLLSDNPRLVYARLTGYGQTGHFKDKAGHDINYAAMSGVLSAFKKNNQISTMPPYLADFAAGGLLCAFSIVLALFERTKSGKGQIIDSSMTEGVAYLATWLFKSKKLPIWMGEPGTNVLDGGFPFYGTYETKDGKLMAVGALEPQFYVNLLKGLQLSEDEYGQANDPDYCRQAFKSIFLTKTQEEWCRIFEDLDACVTPVLDPDDVHKHKCNATRNSFYVDDENLVIPEPGPKLSRTPGHSAGKQPSPSKGQHTIEILTELGYNNAKIEDFINKGYIYANKQSKL